MKRHTLRYKTLVVYADYDQTACTVTASTPAFQAVRGDLMDLIGALPGVNMFVAFAIKTWVASVIPANVTGTVEKNYLHYANLRVTPETIVATFRIAPDKFRQHLLRYEG